jgi:hypothetical protein
VAISSAKFLSFQPCSGLSMSCEFWPLERPLAENKFAASVVHDIEGSVYAP